ncbi:hypothetical protein MRB53_028456 [Persea americana]|uniref:Uncharacterized protein n=1 Tax=Persea americana TaxID=3435 RepID=A0ACC2KFZ0_PERAE|nr:hypothetical protein MRB53_028456 [Persea americana]
MLSDQEAFLLLSISKSADLVLFLSIGGWISGGGRIDLSCRGVEYGAAAQRLSLGSWRRRQGRSWRRSRNGDSSRRRAIRRVESKLCREREG